MSNPNSSQFGLYTSSLIIIIARLASRYLIALKKKKTEKANTKEKEKQHTWVEHSQQRKRPPTFFLWTQGMPVSRVSSPINIVKKNIQEVGLPLCEGFNLRQSVETHKIYSQQTHTHTKSHTRSHIHRLKVDAGLTLKFKTWRLCLTAGEMGQDKIEKRKKEESEEGKYST